MIKNKYLGSIYGLAIGDALGFPNEFINRYTNLQRTNGKGITDFISAFDGDFPPGTYTDDTQMSLAIAKALINSDLKNYSIDGIMKNITKEFINWINDPKNNRAPGKTCIYGCRNLEEGINWKQSGDYNSKGCGSAMRSAPIGLIFYDDLDKLVEVATETSRCTHAHPTGISAGIGTAYLTSLALQGIDYNTWIDNIKKQLFFNEEFKNKIKQINDVFDYEDSFKALEEIGQGWIGEEAVAMALYCFLKNPFDYEKTVLTAANCEGDTDSVACIAGAISGTYNGTEKIPEKWVNNVEDSEYLKEIAEKLFNKKEH
ncbi:ADP-ribosylglycohydrolase family protein [Candidatus Woesearchaeota archaeon]|nr:ADP-ribosylglycohydrolase family protein [Candidatus Woesearchaeota archaeon]